MGAFFCPSGWWRLNAPRLKKITPQGDFERHRGCKKTHFWGRSKSIGRTASSETESEPVFHSSWFRWRSEYFSSRFPVSAVCCQPVVVSKNLPYSDTKTLSSPIRRRNKIKNKSWQSNNNHQKVTHHPTVKRFQRWWTNCSGSKLPRKATLP